MERNVKYIIAILLVLVSSAGYAADEWLNSRNTRTDIYTWNNSVWQPVLTPNVFKTFNVAVCATEAPIWTPATGKKFRMMGYTIGASAAGVVDFKDNTAGTTIFTTRTGTNIPTSVDIKNGILSGTVNYVLTITSSVAAACSGTVWGIEE